MTLAAGTRLGPYEIIGSLGAGGMGEVYRALDPRLHREVAIKVLPPAFASDADRLQRFEREARLLASLQHPRIAAVHGLEESDARRFLVMELVRGRTLADRLAAGAMATEEALDVARQVAEGLEAAHQHGIVHRDLKPSNIQVGSDGAVKLLDFGLAKAIDDDAAAGDAALSRSPTMSAPMTGTGVILGTAPYMSPEQARGRGVDEQTDIWAFGCVLYEMLTGRRAFSGPTVSDTLAAVLRGDPDWSALPDELPPPVPRLLRRCLEKDPRRRLHDIADARIELEEAVSEPRTSAPGTTGRPLQPARGRPRWTLPAAVLLLAAASALGYVAGRRTAAFEPARRPTPTRALVALPPDHRLAGWASPVLALSADGRRLAFVASIESDGRYRAGLREQQLFVHHLDTGQTQAVPESASAEGPFFSPDGNWVAFATDVSGAPRPGQLKKFSVATGLTQAICGIQDYFGGDWGEDGTILFVEVPTRGLSRVPASGGRPEVLVPRIALDGTEQEATLYWPQRLPGGRLVLVTDGAGLDVAVIDLQTRVMRRLGLDARHARYARPGQLLFVHRQGTLMAVPFDAEKGTPTGAAVALAPDIALGNQAGGAFTASHTGTLAYATGYLRGSGREPRRLVRVAKGGPARPVEFEPDLLGRWPRVAPDGNRVVVTTWDGATWIYDLARRTRSMLPAASVGARDFPLWSPDGETIVFGSHQAPHPGWHLYAQRADGSGPPERLEVPWITEKHPGSLTPDGRTLLFAANEPGKEGVYSLPATGKGAPALVLAGRHWDLPLLSPDGRLLAYESDETGQHEIVVQPFPGLGPKVQVSAGGGSRARWSPDGRQIFYRWGPRIYSVQVDQAPRLQASLPVVFAEVPGLVGFDVMPDGKEIVAITQVMEAGNVRHLQLIVNWSGELDRLAPAGSAR